MRLINLFVSRKGTDHIRSVRTVQREEKNSNHVAHDCEVYAVNKRTVPLNVLSKIYPLFRCRSRNLFSDS